MAATLLCDQRQVRVWGSKLWVGGSVAAATAYLVLLGRIGPAPAAYTTVLYPVVALAISTLFEGYVWTPWAAAGLALVALGNVIIQKR